MLRKINQFEIVCLSKNYSSSLASPAPLLTSTSLSMTSSQTKRSPSGTRANLVTIQPTEMPLETAATTTTRAPSTHPRTSKTTSLLKRVRVSLRARRRLRRPSRISTDTSQPVVKPTTAAVIGPLLIRPRTEPHHLRRLTRSTDAVCHLICRVSMSAHRKC